MKSAFLFLALVAGGAVCLLSCGGGGSPSASVSGTCDFQAGGNCTLVVNGVSRTYLLHIPANFQKNSSALIVALHGSQSSGAGMESQSQLSVKADQAGFAVAYPDALLSSQGHTLWSVFYNDFAFTGTPPDDVGFLRALISTLQSNLQPDPKKIYVTGFSVGGYMAHRVGVQLSDLVAAVGVVEGTLYAIAPGDTRSVPAVTAPVSVLIFHGDQDSAINYCGSSSSTSTASSQDQTYDYWIGNLADSCSLLSTASPLCDAQGHITAVTEKDGTGCRNNTEVIFYKLIGGTHTWYNTPMNVAGQVPYNPALDSSTGVITDDVLWSFFSSHAKP